MTTCMGNCCSPGRRLWCLWWCLFVLFFFPRDVLDEILNLIESVSEGFPSYFFMVYIYILGSDNMLRIKMIVPPFKVSELCPFDYFPKHFCLIYWPCMNFPLTLHRIIRRLGSSCFSMLWHQVKFKFLDSRLFSSYLLLAAWWEFKTY